MRLSDAMRAQKPHLLPEKDVAALANELSGDTAKRNLEGIARTAVSAEYGPIPREMVVEYLEALEKIGLLEQVK